LYSWYARCPAGVAKSRYKKEYRIAYAQFGLISYAGRLIRQFKLFSKNKSFSTAIASKFKQN